MDTDKFAEFCSGWHIAAMSLADAYNAFRLAKHKLEQAKADAWADGQIIGKNDAQRKAALFIIVEPFIAELIKTEEVVMRLQIEERYLRDMIDYSIWNGINNPNAWQGIRNLIDVYNPK